MCKSMEDMRDKAWLEGKAEGIVVGSFKTLTSLVQDGILTLAQAAERLGLSEAEFAEKIAAAGYKC